MDGPNGEVAENGLRAKVNLNIWDVPADLAFEFINIAKERYNKKSCLLFVDIWEKAKKYDQMQGKKLEELEQRVSAIEQFVASIEVEEKKEETDNEEKLKVFGR